MNGERVLTDAERIAFHLACETDGERTPAQADEAEEIAALESMMETSGIRRVEQLLDGEMTRRVLTLTPEKWRELGPFERRTMLDWCVRRAKLFEERAAFMSRNIVAGELDVPACLREMGAA